MDPKTERRTAREAAIRELNSVAESVAAEQLPLRATNDDIEKFFRELCKKISSDELQQVSDARKKYLDNGGTGSMPADLLAKLETPESTQHDEDGVVPSHKKMEQSFYGKRPFRLCAKAFMLTFNSLGFLVSEDLWKAFRTWVQERAAKFGAEFWSCTMELSTHAADTGRVHFHCYFSWHSPSKNGVDHRNTDEWVFQKVRPRVDANSERRGPHEWLKATQHGHFYVSVMKEGTLYADTNYPPWESNWVPEAWWVMKLYKQHKLQHKDFLALSVRLREGHDRRKAMVDAVVAAEKAAACQDEQRLALEAIMKKAKPMKPLPPLIEAWKMHFEEVDDRYKMLVLHGPSRTGKSRLARSLFGSSRTLVVDVQHADHPDLINFRREEHKAILLDEMQGAEFIIGNKKVLQAHVDGAILGQSATQRFTYSVFLWRVPIILTTNNWDYSSFSPADKDWIRENCVEILIDAPVWESAKPASTESAHRHAKVSATCCPLCGQRWPDVSRGSAQDRIYSSV